APTMHAPFQTDCILQQRERGAAQQAEIRLGILLPRPVRVFAEAHVHHPVHLVLDAPMTPRRSGNGPRPPPRKPLMESRSPACSPLPSTYSRLTITKLRRPAQEDCSGKSSGTLMAVHSRVSVRPCPRSRCWSVVPSSASSARSKAWCMASRSFSWLPLTAIT